MTLPISGFTFVRNGVRFGYPFQESIRSLLPLVDELVVVVGRGTDETLYDVRALAQAEPRIKIYESDWPVDDPERMRGGAILAEQTNLALERCTHDWCVYLQADEVLHETDLPQLRAAIEAAASRPEVDALVLDYVHFYGSYDVVQVSRSAYRREVRVVRRSSGARSVGDAQSFRSKDGSKLRAVLAGARVYHYGWVRPPGTMREKTFFMDELYHGPASEEQRASGVPHTGRNYEYKRIPGLRYFAGTHPAVMRDRIAQAGAGWDFESAPREWRPGDFKKAVLDGIELLTGRRLFEYRSYELL